LPINTFVQIDEFLWLLMQNKVDIAIDTGVGSVSVR
jgi:hypothetical protein